VAWGAEGLCPLCLLSSPRRPGELGPGRLNQRGQARWDARSRVSSCRRGLSAASRALCSVSLRLWCRLSSRRSATSRAFLPHAVAAGARCWGPARWCQCLLALGFAMSEWWLGVFFTWFVWWWLIACCERGMETARYVLRCFTVACLSCL